MAPSTSEQAHHVEQSASPGDEDAIALLLDAGNAAAARAPAAAARWFDAALRLLPGGDSGRQVDVRVALASAQRSLGELELSRHTLLEAIELLPTDATARRIELTAWCAAVEHWLGRHDDAHRRLMRAWDDLADQTSAEAAALQIELSVDGLYEMDFAQAQSMGAGALETARSIGDDALIAAAASALALGEVVEGRITSAQQHRDEASRSSIACRTRSSRRAWRRCITSAGRRTTSSATTTRSHTPTAASRLRARPARAGCWCR